MKTSDKLKEAINIRMASFSWLQEQLGIKGNQKYLSDKLSCSKQYVSQVYKGRNISDSELLKWIQIFEDKNKGIL